MSIINLQTLITAGLAPDAAEKLYQQLKAALLLPPAEAWQRISRELAACPFALHLSLFQTLFPNWQTDPASAPAWLPDTNTIPETNLHRAMTAANITSLPAFRQWAHTHPAEFWDSQIKNLGIVQKQSYTTPVDLTNGIENPRWLAHARLNIADSCFTAPPSATALIFSDDQQVLRTRTYGELDHDTSCIAQSLLTQKLRPGDAIAIAMPMTVAAVTIYLGILKMGGVVVSIADSFSAEEMATRLCIANAKAVFTQDGILRGEKQLPLYAKLIAANAPRCFVLPCDKTVCDTLREGDMTWRAFLTETPLTTSQACDPDAPCNILFSSGTTGEPKAIPWTHTTPIKAASDAYLHHDIRPGDVLAWPTNLGWMMGPWLIFAALINRAAIAIYPDVARDRAFGEFVQDAKVTMLGVVPTLVATWRQSHCMEGLDWSAIRAFSSTGECSNAEDMLYLMSLAGYKPVIEYCGGTEIGGAYLTSTLIENNYPAAMTGPACGLDLVLIDETGQLTNNGEVALLPPSIGLSNTLLNANHHTIYYANMPAPNGQHLRRHGDQAERLSNGGYRVLGRVDDTMNLGGIKVSAAEIERALIGIAAITETAAIAVTPPHGGPSQLVIYATSSAALEKALVLKAMQARINAHLNPLFKIQEVILVPELPKTASNKIMRRLLRKNYHASVE